MAVHHALARVAAPARPVVSAESVAQYQSERITRRVYDRSALPFPKPPVPARPATRRGTVLWPYPRGSADTIDRARCADLFLRAHPRFRMVTEDDLGRAAAEPDQSMVLFCPFDAVLPL